MESKRKRDKRRNRVRLEKREPMTETYLLELKNTIRTRVYRRYKKLVFCTQMFLADVHIMESENLEFYMTENLFIKRSFISINRIKSKQETKAYLFLKKNI